MNLDSFVCVVISVFRVMKGPDGSPGPVSPPPLEYQLIVLAFFLIACAVAILGLRLFKSPEKTERFTERAGEGWTVYKGLNCNSTHGFNMEKKVYAHLAD